jgi:molybdopterin/thiamine biosynthesis adenylyltransferase
VRQVELLALEESLLPLPYVRNVHGLSLGEQLALCRSEIALVGLGGLGGFVLELLVRAGVGSIEAADGDVFEEHNLNRQLLSLEAHIGQAKSQAAAERSAQVNSGVEVRTHAAMLDSEGFYHLLRSKDFAVDALGGLEVRRRLHEAAARASVPLVTGAVGGEVGYVSTIYPGEAGPLALWGGALGAEEQLGCPPHAVSAIAALQCAEAVHLAAGRKPQLRGRLGVLDLQDMSWAVFDL